MFGAESSRGGVGLGPVCGRGPGRGDGGLGASSRRATKRLRSARRGRGVRRARRGPRGLNAKIRAAGARYPRCLLGSCEAASGAQALLSAQAAGEVLAEGDELLHSHPACASFCNLQKVASRARAEMYVLNRQVAILGCAWRAEKRRRESAGDCAPRKRRQRGHTATGRGRRCAPGAASSEVAEEQGGFVKTGM